MKTIEFLPDRLNAETVVFKGFTTPELGYAALIGAVAGLILSLMMMLVIGIGWPIIPTCTLITPLMLIFIGGRFLVSFKRNKPNFYLYLRIQKMLSHMGIGSKLLVRHDRSWSLRRSQRVRRGGV
ncbi:TIGR03750 family conjugal transfer protein [Salmonella enterica]|nr:TIGR03750 family conjugal transfer protein [Salmonella enterica]EDT3816758.1 TIGR03750 family conjugal transfer protein [Salmonella enterica subsp. enterica serovar Javiana]VEA96328.1 membrane protein [Salmonella enterica subsp. houtenae]ECR4553466.1 TIGR03750 family conjugal transfer protein [Salmonella enterica]EGD5599974.1 TIGR03750 family conjugal transfer protein [Salmonella enterica]